MKASVDASGGKREVVATKTAVSENFIVVVAAARYVMETLDRQVTVENLLASSSSCVFVLGSYLHGHVRYDSTVNA